MSNFGFVMLNDDINKEPCFTYVTKTDQELVSRRHCSVPEHSYERGSQIP